MYFVLIQLQETRTVLRNACSFYNGRHRNWNHYVSHSQTELSSCTVSGRTDIQMPLKNTFLISTLSLSIIWYRYVHEQQRFGRGLPLPSTGGPIITNFSQDTAVSAFSVDQNIIIRQAWRWKQQTKLSSRRNLGTISHLRIQCETLKSRNTRACPVSLLS
jgi:hypothetical protein